jgi:hypothetical protein
MDWVGGLWVQTCKVDYLRVSYIYLEYRAVYQIHRDNVSKTRNKNRISPELIELEYEMEQLFQHFVVVHQYLDKYATNCSCSCPI